VEERIVDVLDFAYSVERSVEYMLAHTFFGRNLRTEGVPVRLAFILKFLEMI